MNTFWKVALGFIGGVVFTLGLLLLFGILFSVRKMPRVSSEGESWEAIKPNIHYFELSTKRGDITLHTLMPKDSVRILMGKPNTVDVDDIGMDVYETWKYKGRNRVIDEFTVEFVNGRLRSVRQYRE